MRQGLNTIRDVKCADSKVMHQIIIPFFVDRTDYYKDSVKILEIMLSSLRVHSFYEHKVSLVVNGINDSDIHKKLYAFFEKGLVDELIIDPEKIGKINAIAKVLRSADAAFVTIADSDVKFLKNWDKEVFSVFNAFKKAGAVSPTPVFRTHNRLTYNIWFDYLLSSQLKFRKVINPEGLTQFAKSIGWSRLDEKFKDVILTLKAPNGVEAVVGNSHFCVTYRRDVFNYMPNYKSSFLLGGDSEDKYLDKPVVKCDLYRLATQDNHAMHMGNTLENWMNIKETSVDPKQELIISKNRSVSNKRLSYFIKFWVFGKSFKIKTFKRILYKRKGLSSEQLENFI
jgi:hypothetical protein